MKNGGKFGTINISLKMVLKKSETFNKFKRKNIMDKSKMHPPPTKLEGRIPPKLYRSKVTNLEWSKLGVW
jgi:hypothetical protein